MDTNDPRSDDVTKGDAYDLCERERAKMDQDDYVSIWNLAILSMKIAADTTF